MLTAAAARAHWSAPASAADDLPRRVVLPASADVVRQFLDWVETGAIQVPVALVHRIYPPTGTPEVPGKTGRRLLIDRHGVPDDRWATPDDLAALELRCSIERGRDVFMIFAIPCAVRPRAVLPPGNASSNEAGDPPKTFLFVPKEHLRGRLEYAVDLLRMAIADHVHDPGWRVGCFGHLDGLAAAAGVDLGAMNRGWSNAPCEVCKTRTRLGLTGAEPPEEVFTRWMAEARRVDEAEDAKAAAAP